MRVDLVENMLQKILYETANRTERKLKRRAARLLEKRDKKIKDLKHRNDRGTLLRVFKILSNMGISKTIRDTKYYEINISLYRVWVGHVID